MAEGIKRGLGPDQLSKVSKFPENPEEIQAYFEDWKNEPKY